MPENYSPKLKEVMAHISAILKEADIAGYVVLNEPGFSEFLIEVEPSWSVLQLIEGGIRIHSALEDYGGDVERQKKDLAASVGLLQHLVDLLGTHVKVFEALHRHVCEQIDVEHTEGVFTPHRPH